MLTQAQIAQQMIAQIRVLDPNISCEIGTPERKIIDTVAQSLAEAGVDSNTLTGALDLESKFGVDLDSYVGLFGFGRQTGATATGFVTFKRVTAATYPISVPRQTQVAATVNGATITFMTTDMVTMTTGNTQVIAPIQALLPGATANVAANTITQFANIGAPPLGITTVTNENPTTGGGDQESDAELKVRFKNTVFRNMAGTESQYMALALSTQFSTKANVVGPISRYQEYIQVPWVDDSRFPGPSAALTANATNGNSTLTGVVITSSSGVPLIGSTVTSGSFSSTITDIDPSMTIYTLADNWTGTTGSHTFVAIITQETTDGWGGVSPTVPLQWTTLPSNNPYAQYIYLDVPYYMSNGGSGDGTVFYTTGVDFVMNAPPIDAGDTYREYQEVPSDIPNPATTPNHPNFTLYNVYWGGNTAVALPNPGNVVLVEYSYMSAESRNNITRNILNCVDVYVNGENALNGDAVIPTPQAGASLFTNNPIDPLYVQNFRRQGQPTVTPTIGNILQPLFFQPVISLPSQIVVGNYTYLLGTHYWMVEDWTLLGDTVRARNGIEWSATANGMNVGDPTGGPFTGPPITSTGVGSLTVSGYTYDRNIIDLQTALEGAKQVTTDVLAHRSRDRYFKLDLTIVYTGGNLPASVNPAIQSAIQTFFDGQYFGGVILLSDILLVVRQVSGVSNVRWSNDVPSPNDDNVNTLNRVVECDINGNPLGAGYTYNTDFFLRDNELPTFPTGQVAGDTLAGLILRPRAENTFIVT